MLFQSQNIDETEIQGFELQDIEAWRGHFARTARLWSQRLWAQRDRAADLVGSERCRVWLAFLAGVSFAFTDGSLRVYQVLATKHAAKGLSGLPPTREDLFHGESRQQRPLENA